MNWKKKRTVCCRHIAGHPHRRSFTRLFSFHNLIYMCVCALAYREHSETVDNIELRTPKKCMLHTEQTRSTPSERRTHAHILYFVLDIKRVNRIHLSPPHNKCNHVIPYNSTCMLLQQNFRSLLWGFLVWRGWRCEVVGPKTFHLLAGWLTGRIYIPHKICVLSLDYMFLVVFN